MKTAGKKNNWMNWFFSAGSGAKKAKHNKVRSLLMENLEDRKLMAVDSIRLNGGTLFITSNNAPSDVSVSISGTKLRVVDAVNGRTWEGAASGVSQIDFTGGNGNDRFVNAAGSKGLRANGGGGNDHLVGGNGDDVLRGGTGNDILLGGGGNDQLWGGAGNDQLNGQAGSDRLYGEAGDDILISVDAAFTDMVDGGSGADTFWVDSIASNVDRVVGREAVDRVHTITSFANGADRTLNGDRIADPAVTRGNTYKSFENNPLFSNSGPVMEDVVQGQLGDCYMLAGVAAVAKDSPQTLRQNMVDFNDGTYGVKLGDKYYRVDNDLPVSSSGATTPAYAQLGASKSMWVAVFEKAFAHYRKGANDYASIEGGWGLEVNRALGGNAGSRWFDSFQSATSLATEIYNRFRAKESVSLGFLGDNRTGAPLVMRHMYTVANVVLDAAGQVSSIVLRNPWGIDGAGYDGKNDGLVRVTPAQIFGLTGQINWGRVS